MTSPTEDAQTEMNNAVESLYDNLRTESDALADRMDRLKFALAELSKQKSQLKTRWEQLAKDQKKLRKERDQFENHYLMFKADSIEMIATDENHLEGVYNRRYKLNVGGQVFECTGKTLCRDRYSLLAAICFKNSPIKPDARGEYFFDRDWYIFRHVLRYLRDRELPERVDVLQDLLREAIFFRLGQLKTQIEIRLGRYQGGAGGKYSASSWVNSRAPIRSRRDEESSYHYSMQRARELGLYDETERRRHLDRRLNDMHPYRQYHGDVYDDSRLLFRRGHERDLQLRDPFGFVGTRSVDRSGYGGDVYSHTSVGLNSVLDRARRRERLYHTSHY